jgi:RNA polymerase sigma-70 factor (ECF subfamily)
MSLQGIVETILIQRAVHGDREAFAELYGRYEKRLLGFIRARTTHDADAQDIAQETRVAVWRKMPTYQPTLGSFSAFAKFWASKKLLQFYEAEGRRRRVVILFSELSLRFPDLEQESEVEAIVSRLKAEQYFSMEIEEEVATKERQLAAVYEELLSLTFNGPSPPHQLLVFGFVKLLEWKPREVVAKLSAFPLRDIEEQLEVEYVNKSQLTESQVFPCFTQVRQSMDRIVGEVVKEPRTRRTYPHLLRCIVGDTRLQDYYTKQAEEGRADNVVKWWDAVSRRVWSEVQSLGQGPLCELFREVGYD